MDVLVSVSDCLHKSVVSGLWCWQGVRLPVSEDNLCAKIDSIVGDWTVEHLMRVIDSRTYDIFREAIEAIDREKHKLYLIDTDSGYQLMYRGYNSNELISTDSFMGYYGEIMNSGHLKLNHRLIEEMNCDKFIEGCLEEDEHELIEKIISHVNAVDSALDGNRDANLFWAAIEQEGIYS